MPFAKLGTRHTADRAVPDDTSARNLQRRLGMFGPRRDVRSIQRVFRGIAADRWTADRTNAVERDTIWFDRMQQLQTANGTAVVHTDIASLEVAGARIWFDAGNPTKTETEYQTTTDLLMD